MTTHATRNARPRTFWASALLVATVAGCAVDGSGDPPTNAADRSTEHVSSSARIEGQALLRHPDYISARNITADRLLNLDRKVAHELALSPEETSAFLAIMNENRTARLQMQDLLTEHRALSPHHHVTFLKDSGHAATAEVASPAFVRRRIAQDLGSSRLQAYLELMRHSDRWRFSEDAATRPPASVLTNANQLLPTGPVVSRKAEVAQ